MSARQRPRAFNRAASRMVATDSSRARSMNAHVLTMRHSASSGRSTSGKPASVSMPSISSESTWFLGHPSVVRWTFIGSPKYTPQASGDDLHSEAAPVPFGRRREDARRARVDPSRGDEERHRVHDVVARDRPGAERAAHAPGIEPRDEPPERGEADGDVHGEHRASGGGLADGVTKGGDDAKLERAEPGIARRDHPSGATAVDPTEPHARRSDAAVIGELERDLVLGPDERRE